MTKNDETVVTKDSMLAVSLKSELRDLVQDLAQKEGKSEAHIARVALAAFLTSKGYTVPEVVEARRGAKSGGKVNPMAAKFGLSNQELARRTAALIAQGLSMHKIASYDFSIDPKPVKHRVKSDDAV